MDKDKEEVLDWKFYFKKSYQAELFGENKSNLHCLQSESFLTHHLKAKRPTDIIHTGPPRSVLQEFGSCGQMMKLVSEKVANVCLIG